MTLGSPPAFLQQEGRASFAVGSAFYRPQSTIARDLAVLAAALYRRQRGQLRVLDVMTGCGVRPLRYALEAEADWIWANEGNPDLAPLLAQNLAVLAPGTYQVTHQDAHAVFFSCYQRQDFYDLVDIDNFGGPAPYLASGLWAARLGGLIYLTSTDGRTTGGHDVAGSLRTYGAAARSHPAVYDQGLRLVIGHAAQTAAARGLGIEPVFALFTGQVHRAMVRLVAQPTLTEATFGFVAHCHGCGHGQTVGWRQLGRVQCPCGDPPVLSGPLWLGPLHGAADLATMAALALDWGWTAQARRLERMLDEVDLPPYYYSLGEIGRRGRMDIPNRDRLIAALRARGYGAAVPSVDDQGVRTTADFGDCVAIAQGLDRGGHSSVQ